MFYVTDRHTTSALANPDIAITDLGLKCYDMGPVDLSLMSGVPSVPLSAKSQRISVTIPRIEYAWHTIGGLRRSRSRCILNK